MAGLNIFVPNPPKTILPKAMEITPANKDIHNGMVGGRVKATKEPVTKAAIVTFPAFFLRTNKYSVK